MTLHDCEILLVDDEPSLLELLENLLKKEGYKHIDTAPCCRQALSLIRENEYHMLVLDVMLPDGDGFHLFERIKDIKGNSVCVVFLSARDEDISKLRGLGLGADDYITKPFLPEELLLRIKSILKRAWRTLDKNMIDKVGKALIDWARVR